MKSSHQFIREIRPQEIVNKVLYLNWNLGKIQTGALDRRAESGFL